LLRCLETIRKDIINVWNFADQEKFLASIEFKAMTLRLIQDLGDPNDPGTGSIFSQNLATIQAELQHAESSSTSPPPVRPPSVFLDWLSGTYNIKELPARILRTLMGFIVDLTLVLEQLFWVVFRRDACSISRKEIHEAFNKYADLQTSIHQEIRAFVSDRNPKRPDEAHQAVERLIKENRLKVSRGEGDVHVSQIKTPSQSRQKPHPSCVIQ